VIKKSVVNCIQDNYIKEIFMNRSKNVFAMLADRAEEGDSSARGELSRQLEPELVHIVRRVIQSGAGLSSMDRRILAEARRVGLDAVVARSEDGELLIRKVARCVSSLLLAGLRAKQGDHFPRNETVCN
jgi:hypothetical protein